MADKKIPGPAYIIIGAGMILMSVVVGLNTDSIEKFSIFILIGAVFIVIGFLKIISKEKKSAETHHKRHEVHHERARAHAAKHALPAHHHEQHQKTAHPAHHAQHSQVVRCASCGVKIHPLFKWCPNCGQKLK